MPRSDTLGWRALEWIALLLALGRFVAWLTDPTHWPGLVEGNDFRVFYDGAVLFLRTGNPYGQGFVSPPWFALLLAPLTLLPYSLAAWLWMALAMTATAAAAWLTLDFLDLHPSVPRAVLTALLLAWWPPGEAGLLLGQNSWLVLLVVAAALVSLRQGSATLAGGLLALGLIKPHLVGMLLLGVGLACWRAGRLRSFSVGLVGTLVAITLATLLARRAWVPALVSGLPESWNYWGSTVTTNTLLAAVWDVQDPVRSLLALPLLVVGAALTCWVWTRGADSLQWRASVTLALTFLITPYAYPHDYVLLLLPALLVTKWLLARLSLTGVGVALGVGCLLWVLPRPWVYDPSRFSTLLVPMLLLALLLCNPRSRASYGRINWV